jgi:leader peptidase (prepilin peptidase) / N-methyltransferase
MLPASEGYLIASLGGGLGAVIGSFINCARYRIPRGIGLNRPAYSYCASCGARLTAVDLVPIFSWLWLVGRCRHCRTPIGVDTLVVEVFCAAMGAFVLFLISAVI